MEPVCYPVNKTLLVKELTEDRLLRKSNKGGNEIYIFTAEEAPNLMKEVGRVRELAFRSAGGGTGLSCDIDEFDLKEDMPCRQLVVWDPQSQTIIGGYRFKVCKGVPYNEKGEPDLAISEIFRFSDKFKEEYLPYTVELGRSFVHPVYQSSKMGTKSLFALDNLWDGLGALTIDYPEMKYFLGKVTMYRHFDLLSRNMILFFMNKYFGDREHLIEAVPEYRIVPDFTGMETIFSGKSYDEDYKILLRYVKNQGARIPPLVNAYMGLSPTMKCFGTSLNPFFGNVEETGILITLKDVYDAKKLRHIDTYIPRILSGLRR